MHRALRTIAIVILSLIMLLVAAGIITSKLINPNDYKAQIVNLVNKNTGRELSIDGDITLSVFPWLGVELQKIKLSNPKAYRDQSFLEVDEAEIKLHLLPLLFGKIEFGSIVLDHAKLNLIKKSPTANNWSDLNAKELDNPADTQNSPTNSSNGSSYFKQIKITNISIQNSQLRLADLENQNVISINNLNLDSSGIGLAKSFPLYLSFDLKSKDPKLAIQFNGNTQAYIDPKKKIYKLDSLQANGQLSTTQASNLSFAAKGDFAIDLNQQAWNLKNVTANLAQMRLDIDSQGDLSKSTGNGSIHIKSFNAQTLLQQMSPGIQFKNAKALTNVSAQFSYTATPDKIQVPDFVAKIDNSNLKANFDYQISKKRNLNYLVQLDQINFDAYQITLPTHKPNKRPAETNPLFVLAFLTNLDGAGKIQIDKLTYNQVPLNNILIQSKAANNIITLNPISATAYDGKIAANANLNLQSSTPILNADATVSNLDLDQAFSKAGETSRIRGLFNLQTHLNTSGRSIANWLNNLQGSGSINVTQGVIEGIDLNFWLLQGISVLKKLTPSLKGNTNQTPFDGMKATFTIYQGILSNQDLLISTQQLMAKGQGTINIPQQTIKYHIFAQSTDKKLLSNNLQIPILVTGSLLNPKVQLDMAVLTASLIKQGLTLPVGAATAIPKGALDIISKISF